MRIAALGALALLTVFLCQLVVFQQRRLTLTLASGERVTLKLPRVWEKREYARCIMESAGGRAEIRSDIYAHPTAILPGRTAGTVMVVHDFDTYSELIVFQLRKPNSAVMVPEALRSMVLSSSLPLDRATLDDVRSALDLVSNASDARLEELTVPTLDLGLWKARVPRSNLLRQLNEILRDYTDRLSGRRP